MIMKKKVILLLSTFSLVGALAFALNTYAQNTNTPAPHRAERHPAIHRALVSLREAKAYLEHANHDFGGHRVAAIKAVDEAVQQLELAQKFDKQ